MEPAAPAHVGLGDHDAEAAALHHGHPLVGPGDHDGAVEHDAEDVALHHGHPLVGPAPGDHDVAEVVDAEVRAGLDAVEPRVVPDGVAPAPGDHDGAVEHDVEDVSLHHGHPLVGPAPGDHDVAEVVDAEVRAGLDAVEPRVVPDGVAPAPGDHAVAEVVDAEAIAPLIGPAPGDHDGAVEHDAEAVALHRGNGGDHVDASEPDSEISITAVIPPEIVITAVIPPHLSMKLPPGLTVTALRPATGPAADLRYSSSAGDHDVQRVQVAAEAAVLPRESLKLLTVAENGGAELVPAKEADFLLTMPVRPVAAVTPVAAGGSGAKRKFVELCDADYELMDEPFECPFGTMKRDGNGVYQEICSKMRIDCPSVTLTIGEKEKHLRVFHKIWECRDCDGDDSYSSYMPDEEKSEHLQRYHSGKNKMKKIGENK
jgi:ribosomal protein L37AE/L43A